MLFYMLVLEFGCCGGLWLHKYFLVIVLLYQSPFTCCFPLLDNNKIGTQFNHSNYFCIVLTSILFHNVENLCQYISVCGFDNKPNIINHTLIQVTLSRLSNIQ